MWQIIPKLRGLKATPLAPASLIWAEFSWTAGLCPMCCKQDGAMHLQPAGNCKASESLRVSIHKCATSATLVRIAMACLSFFAFADISSCKFDCPCDLAHLRNPDQISSRGTSLWLRSQSRIPVLHVQHTYTVRQTQNSWVGKWTLLLQLNWS